MLFFVFVVLIFKYDFVSILLYCLCDIFLRIFHVVLSDIGMILELC